MVDSRWLERINIHMIFKTAVTFFLWCWIGVAYAQQNTSTDPFACRRTDSPAVGPEAIKIVVHGPVLLKEPFHYELLVQTDGAITLNEKHKKNSVKSKKVTAEAIRNALRELEKTQFFDDECCYCPPRVRWWIDNHRSANQRANKSLY